jgi:predicted aspartyl protease
MTGHVSERHALLPVTFRLSNQPELTIEFVVGTGFTDYLTLPVGVVAALGLPLLHRIEADLADDSTVQMAVHVRRDGWLPNVDGKIGSFV